LGPGYASYCCQGTPLVKGKETLVRVYGGVTGATGPVNNVACELVGVRQSDFSTLPGSPLKPRNPERITIFPNHDFDDQSASNDLTWNFDLPISWTQEDYILLRAVVNPQNKGQIEECGTCFNQFNEKYVKYIPFEEYPRMHFYLFRPCIRRSANDPMTQCDVVPLNLAVQTILGSNSMFPKMWPVKKGGIDIHIPVYSNFTFDGNFDKNGVMSSNRMEEVLDKIKSRYIFNHFFSPWYANHIYVGIVPPPVGSVPGIASLGKPVATVQIHKGQNNSSEFTCSYEYTHEIGHTYGINHVPCPPPGHADYADDSNLWYPRYKSYFWGSIGYWGINTDNYPLIPKPPKIFVDFMEPIGSFCGPEWISLYTQGLIYNWNKKKPINFDKDLLLMYQDTSKWGEQSYLYIPGQVDSNGVVNLGPSFRFEYPNLTLEEPVKAQYQLLFENAKGDLLLTHKFNPDTVMDLEESIQRINIFTIYPAQTRRIKMTSDAGKILKTIEVSRNAPQIKLIYPNGDENWTGSNIETVQWSARDLDGDRLYYTVMYSVDAGNKWQTIATNLSETQLELDASSLPGSRNTLIKIIATDGVNTSTDISDAFFTVDNKPPFIVITAPAEGSFYVSNESVSLDAMATDLEDGPLYDKDIAWYTVEGQFLGNGRYLESRELNQGVHHIVAMATDSYGFSASATVTVLVVPPKLDIQINPFHVDHLCSRNASHTIHIGWKIEPAGDIAEIGPMNVRMPDGQLSDLKGEQISSNGYIAIPIKARNGGKVELYMTAKDINGDWHAINKFITIDSCN
jgi:hypothetical protein